MGGLNTYTYVESNPLFYFDPYGLAGETTNLGGGTKVRIDNPHVPGQQKHGHFETPKGQGVVNLDGTQSHKNKGSLDNMNKKVKDFLKKRGFNLRCPLCTIIPPYEKVRKSYCEQNPYAPGCIIENNQCPLA